MKNKGSELAQVALVLICFLVFASTLIQLVYAVSEKNPTFVLEADVVTDFPVCPGEYIEVVVHGRTRNSISPILVVSTIYQEDLTQVATSSSYYASPESPQEDFVVSHRLFVPATMENGIYLYSVAVNEIGHTDSEGFTVRFQIEDNCNDR